MSPNPEELEKQERLDELRGKAEDFALKVRGALGDNELYALPETIGDETLETLEEWAAYPDLEARLDENGNLILNLTGEKDSLDYTVEKTDPEFAVIFPELAAKAEVIGAAKTERQNALGDVAPTGTAPAVAEEVAQGVLREQPKTQTELEQFLAMELAELDKKGLGEADLEKLKGFSVEQIRKTSHLLIERSKDKPLSSVRSEFLARLRAYTNAHTNEEGQSVYTVDYQKLGADKQGRSHELYVGLGDILVDPRITMIRVFKKGEAPIDAQRGIVASGKHKGRVGFIDSNGQYVATHTGDQFVILDEKYDPKSDNDQNLVKKLEEEDVARAADKVESVEGYDLKGFALDRRGGKMNRLTDEVIAGRLDKQGYDGVQLVQFAKEKCEQYGVPYSAFVKLVDVESGWDVEIPNKQGSSALGLGQFMPSTFDGFKNAVGRADAERTNPFDNIEATIWLMNNTKEKMAQAGVNMEELSLYDQGVTYYIFHHEGSGAAPGFLKFIKAMSDAGYKTDAEVREHYDEFKHLLHKNTQKRVSDKGMGHLLQVYALAQKVGRHAEAKDFVTLGANELVDLSTDKNISVLGSSIAHRMRSAHNSELGVYGIVSYNSKNFAARLREVWPNIKPQLSQNVVISGLVHNEAADNGAGVNHQARAEQIVNNHLELVNFLKAEGFNVKIAEAHIYGKRSKEIEAFNKILEEKYPDLYLKTGFDEESGLDKDGVHQNANGTRQMEAAFERAFAL